MGGLAICLGTSVQHLLPFHFGFSTLSAPFFSPSPPAPVHTSLYLDPLAVLTLLTLYICTCLLLLQCPFLSIGGFFVTSDRMKGPTPPALSDVELHFGRYSILSDTFTHFVPATVLNITIDTLAFLTPPYLGQSLRIVLIVSYSLCSLVFHLHLLAV